LSFGQLSAQSQDTLDYLLIYYLPYDNDLSDLGDDIIDELLASSKENIGIVVQADFEDTLGHQRFIILDGKIDTIQLTTETSNISDFRDYLTWTSEQFTFRQHAIFFLNHGADLESMGIDIHPHRAYYNITEVSEAIEEFNGHLERMATLLVLQQCNRSSIEIVYEFRDCAHYTLASQLELGAPNSYYKEMVNLIHQDPGVNGEELGKSIAYFEGYDMYHSYTLIDNSTLDSYVLELASFVNQLKKTKYDPATLLVETYWAESYWDLHSFLKSVEGGNTTVAAMEFIPSSKTVMHLPNPKSDFASDYCGLSIYSPYNKQLKYHKELAIFDVIDYKWLKKNLKKPKQ
jgi:hypothetical protein